MSAADVADAAPWRGPGDRSGTRLERYRRQQALAAARRHSRRVRRLRILLPVLGTAIIVTLFVLTRLSLPGDLDLTAARLSVTRNAIIMNNPNIAGFDDDNRNYSVRADRAIQSIANPQKVRMEAIEARVEVAGQGNATISAESGDYDNAAGKLQLNGPIAVETSEGYSLRMTGADIDLKSGTMESQQPVTLGYEDSTTVADRVAVSEGGKVIVFDGGVRTTLMPPRRAAGDGPPPPQGNTDGAKQ